MNASVKLAAGLAGQDCKPSSFEFTAAAQTKQMDNRTPGCSYWIMSYSNQGGGFSALYTRPVMIG